MPALSGTVHLEFDREPSCLRYMLRGVWPVRRTRSLEPHIAARWRGHRADPRDLDDFLAITGLPAGRGLPLLYPHTFGFRLPMAILTHPAFPVPIWNVLQTRNHLAQHRPIARDFRMDLETRVLAGRATATGAEFELRTTVHVDSLLAWESLVTFFVRGRFGPPAAPAPLAQSPTDYGPPVAQWTPVDAHHARFGRYTGDYNGIHLWDAYARRFGFAGALFHPPRMLGECLGRLSAAQLCTEPRRLDAWLKGPVPHGRPVRLHARRAGREVTFALFVEPGRPCLVGCLDDAS